MAKQNKIKFNKTEESIFTLISLGVLIIQAFEALTGKEDILHSDFDSAHYNFKDLVDDTIHEALVYQILLKSCSFLDEWNKVFGVKTETKDKNKIILVKKTAKIAYQCITGWSQIREFRNEMIAHNFRDKNGMNVFIKGHIYNSPQSNGEIYLLVFCIERMMMAIKSFFLPEVEKIAFNKLSMKRSHKFMGKREIKKRMKEIDENISILLMRHHVFLEMINSSPDSKIAFFNLSPEN